MPISDEDVTRIRAYFDPVVGRPAWGVKLGEGSFLTLEFGEPVRKAGEKVTHGQWHLWVYFAAWNLTGENELFIGSENDREDIARVVSRLEGKTLTSVEIDKPTLELTLQFSDGLRLRTTAITTEDIEQWHFYTPDGTLSAGPGSKWELELPQRGPGLVP